LCPQLFELQNLKNESSLEKYLLEEFNTSLILKLALKERSFKGELDAISIHLKVRSPHFETPQLILKVKNTTVNLVEV